MLKLNDTLAFALEILSLILLAKWTHSIPGNMWQKILLSIIAITIIAVIWGLYFSPKAPNTLSGIVRWTLEFIILFFPYLQFRNTNFKYLVIGGMILTVNLLVQAYFGRADW